MKNGSVYRCVETNRFFAMEFPFNRWIYLFKQAKTRKYCCFALLFVLFEGGRSCFSPRPGLCGAARRAMEFWGRDIHCVCREVCSIRGQICAKSQPQRISGKALPPRNFGFPARGRLLPARYFNTLAPQKTAGRTLRPAVPG